MRALILLPAALAACNDYGFGDEVPEPPVSNVPPVDDVHQEDKVVQVTTPLADILWVIDNSTSMQNEQDELVEHFPLFIDYFTNSGLDYHIGVTSTDIDNPGNGTQGKLRTIGTDKYIDDATLDPLGIFAQMASMGTDGSGTEKGLGATYMALETQRDTYNAGYYRDDAALHTIVISDERDQTQGSLITQPEFEQWYDGLKNDNGDRTFSCIVTMQGYDRGTAYINTTNAIGGIVWDIADEDWAEVLERLGLQAAGLKREYFLSQRPVPGSVEVHVEDVNSAVFAFEETTLDAYGQPVSTADPLTLFVYDSMRNSVTFVAYVPPPLSTVILDYTLLSTQQGLEEVL